jgi:hypothetical protein
MADATDKTVKIPLYDGKYKNFVMWWTRFKAYAKVQQFAQALGETPEVALPANQDALDALDRSDQANLPALLAAARNDRAMANLAVAFTTAKVMTHYHKAPDEEWPEGLAVNVVKSLLKKFRPTDTIAEVEYIARLEEFKLKKNQDLTELFDHFVEVITQFGVNAPAEKLLIAMAMRKLPEKFVTAYTTMATTLGGAADLETFEQICENIHQTTAKKKDDEDSEDDLNLSAFDKKKSSNGEKCEHCGRPGHKPDNCWMLEKSKDKRPDWFDPVKYNKNSSNDNNNGNTTSSNNSVNNAEMGAFGQGINGRNDGPELLLTALSIPKDMKLLDDPNVWIADTGATCDSTPHAKGAVNLPRNSVCGVKFGDGENNEANAVFDLPGLITDASGKELQSVKMCNVKHVKSANFNLFSITKQQEDGWILHGNRDAIWLTKEDKTVVFDIKIKTSEGMVFAMNVNGKKKNKRKKNSRCRLKMKRAKN